MLTPFFVGKGGRKLTPEEVDRERELVALARSKMGDTSPVGHWTQGATRVVDALGAVLREKRTNKAEAAGLAGADERIAAILAGQGGGNYTASTSGGGNAPSGSWTPAAPGPSPVDVATQGVTGGASFAGLPKADTGILQGGGDFGSAVMTPQEMLIEGAKRRGLDPIDVATAISYETGGKFDPTIKGPTTQWGTHEGLIQFGDPQGEKYGVDFSSPEAAWRTQLDPTSGGVWGYLEDTGVKPGMGLPEIYSAINAGAVGRMGASDANNGGAPGTVADKVAGMGPHRDKAAAFLGGTWTPDPNASVSVSTKGGGGQSYGGGGNVGGMDIASLLALQSDPWVAKKYGGVVDALMGQQFSRQNALWEQQQKMADPMYQAQLAELTAPKPVDPFAGTKEIGGVLYGPDGQGGFVPLITPPSDGAVPLTDPAERAKWGIPPTDTRPYAVKPGEAPKVVGGDGVTVNNNMGGGPELGKLSTDFGYVIDPETNLPRIDPVTGLPTAAPVPGSPAWIEAQRLADKAATGAGKEAQTADVVLGKLDELDALVSESGILSPATGFGAETLAGVGGTRAADTKATIDTIAANMAFDALAEMRAASPTGGALGQITENELALLSSTMASLKQSQSPEQFKRNVAQLREIYTTIRAKADAYPNAAQFGFGGGSPQGTVQGATTGATTEGAVAPTEAPPNAFTSNSTIQQTAEKNGLTPEELWENMSPEARKKFGG